MPPEPIPARPRSQHREANLNWKGGRTIASNGYVLIRVGVDHHLADVRGYAYEHRVVAEQVIGRPLVKGEVVHHKDGDKTNNAHSNLAVMSGNAEHRAHHRKRDDLRLPGQDNPNIQCACGCGREFPLFDKYNRPRLFVSGHNPQHSPALDSVLDVLARLGEMSAREIVEVLGVSRASVFYSLSKLKERGLVGNPNRGVWAIVSPPRSLTGPS